MRCADRETPIVFLSALDAEDDQIRGLAAGERLVAKRGVGYSLVRG